jgi:hypothetical protein
MRRLALILIFAASVCIADPRCPDPRLQQATIGGDTISGSVLLHKKPLKFAQVRLYSSSGKTVWAGATDKDGVFTCNNMPPGDYRLEVNGWGSTTVRLSPKLDKTGTGQIFAFHLLLTDDACLGVIADTN